jgi:predicted  nucleic acid-binding Zn-ribbon protein
MATIEDRVSDLELAQSATSDAIARVDRNVDRLTEKVDAMHRVIAESEVRLRTELNDRISGVEIRISGVENRISGAEQRLGDRIGATERRFVDLLNERFDAVMAALDRLHNPPR